MFDLKSYPFNLTKEMFSDIYDKYAPALYGVLIQKSGNKADAALLLQKTFVTIWKTRENFDPAKSKLFTWLYNTTCSVHKENNNPFIPTEKV